MIGNAQQLAERLAGSDATLRARIAELEEENRLLKAGRRSSDRGSVGRSLRRGTCLSLPQPA
jgi:hypothetical protein